MRFFCSTVSGTVSSTKLSAAGTTAGRTLPGDSRCNVPVVVETDNAILSTSSNKVFKKGGAGTGFWVAPFGTSGGCEFFQLFIVAPWGDLADFAAVFTFLAIKFDEKSTGPL